ncbi:hypothetical protein DPX16_0712 [Anabarilius grahami]|uniref:Uncharacterized protein n=1 Tax=Anabarilius grahami TaxID=495550 RepID=A0A3N0YDH2_ANAGA|nr:hypothetical protein DPX16_0712 [Anabarilius grahami]
MATDAHTRQTETRSVVLQTKKKANASVPSQTIFTDKNIKDIENGFSCSVRLKRPAKQDILLNRLVPQIPDIGEELCLPSNISGFIQL